MSAYSRRSLLLLGDFPWNASFLLRFRFRRFLFHSGHLFVLCYFPPTLNFLRFSFQFSLFPLLRFLGFLLLLLLVQYMSTLATCLTPCFRKATQDLQIIHHALQVTRVWNASRPAMPF